MIRKYWKRLLIYLTLFSLAMYGVMSLLASVWGFKW
jgi:hypothetical protein